MKHGLVIISICAALLGACDDSPEVGNGRESTDDDTSGEGGAASGRGADGGFVGGSGSSLDESELVGDSKKNCTPVTCNEMGATCGHVADGCGELLECGECEDGAECGILEHNECTVLDELCKPISKTDACEGKQCGTEGNGCGGTHDCGSCEDNEVCGAETPFECGVPSSGSTEACKAQIVSCEDIGVECGLIGNGCGGTIDCNEQTGGCEDGEICGLNEPGVCGVPPECEPLSEEEACEDKCGIVSNGCSVDVDGGILVCSDCGENLACGAGGVPNQCGDARLSCSPLDEETACDGISCGAVSDGCSGTIVCGACEDDEMCRSGACEPRCTPLAEEDACEDLQCGLVSDGCGGSYNCGSCEDGEVCGLLEAFQCALAPPMVCVPRTEAEACAGKQCGIVFDGCGAAVSNQIDCGAVGDGCGDDEYCGIEEAFQCDPLPSDDCTPAASCQELGWECGMALDECGNVFDCGAEGRSCNTEIETCIGGIDGPAQCLAAGEEGAPPLDCDVCHAIPDCSGEAQNTTLTGRVITPGRNNSNTANQVSVPNAFVYVLQSNDEADLPAIATGIPDGGTQCERCADEDLGPILVGATTNANGEFTLSGNVPVGEEFLLVVKAGKFRRAVNYTVAANDSCSTVAVDPLQTRLPRNRTDGLGVNLPRVAISTGRVDAMECVFEKMGVSSNEFGLPGAGGSNPDRFHLYRANGASAQGGESTADSVLYSDLDRIMGYDMVVFDCEGQGSQDHNTHDPKIREYVNRGGRLFASHLSFRWLCDNGTQVYDPSDPFDTGLAIAADFPGCGGGNTGGPEDGTGIVSEGRPRANAAKIANFKTWLDAEAASFNPANNNIPIEEPRDLASSVGTGSEEFIWREVDDDEDSVQQFSFNTPYGAPEDEICGRVAYSGFHVSIGTTDEEDFPDHCSGNLTDQEKVLLYMLFDLGNCVTTGAPEPPECVPVADCTGRCGNLPDGCGGIVSCECEGDASCLAGGICGIPECVPTTCGAQGATCGLIADGCGDLVDCGDCPAGQACGLITANQCAITCTLLDEADACEGKCGFVSDGCGGVFQCPGCDGSLSCVQGVCTPNDCDPADCPDNLECGVVSDGCSGTASCGDCVLPEVCGGGGVANQCGRPECPPLSCEDLEAECGWIGDGCGDAVDCGDCPSGQVCTAVGGVNRCVGCPPRDCDDANAECGAIGDGCGDIVQCGECPAGQVCGSEEANQCGPSTQCKPRTCNQAGAECGLIGNGCGGTVNCGACPTGEVCGIEEAFKCDPPPDCDPNSCEELDAECGAIADGCGGLIDCGPCPAGQVCGGLEPNQCAATGVAR